MIDQIVLIVSFRHVCQFFLILNHFVYINEKIYPDEASYSENNRIIFFNLTKKSC